LSVAGQRWLIEKKPPREEAAQLPEDAMRKGRGHSYNGGGP
jgi:hypothetical protein